MSKLTGHLIGRCLAGIFKPKLLAPILIGAKEMSTMLRKIFVFVLCLVIGFMLVAPAIASVITLRDESDWTQACDPEETYWTNEIGGLAYYNLDSLLAISINYASRYAILEKSDPSMPDPVIEYKVTERQIDPKDPDRGCVVTVIETGSNVLAVACNLLDWLYTYQDLPDVNPFYPIIGEQGVLCDFEGRENGAPPVPLKTDLQVDYICMVKFKIPYPGADLPLLANLLGAGNVDKSADLISLHIVASGKGTLAEYGGDLSENNYGYTAGKTAEVALNQLWLNDTGDPSVPGGDFWPVENVSIIEIGKP